MTTVGLGDNNLETRAHATIEWKIVLQRTSSCAWECCFVATIGILFAFSCNNYLLVVQQGSKYVILAPLQAYSTPSGKERT